MNFSSKPQSIMALLSLALLGMVAGCAMDNPIDYSIAEYSMEPTGGEGTTNDDAAPVANSLLIDNGAASTNTAAVTLDFDATDDVAVTHYYASESASTPQASDSGWLSYQQSTSFTLSGSNSLGVFQRTVYVWFKDAAGNVSESASDDISLGVYDRTAPNAVSVVIDGGADNTTTSSVTLTLSATDDQAVTNYYASESAVTPQAVDSGWDNYSTSVSYSFDNDTAETKTVNVWFKDAAGNISGSVADTIERVGLSGVADRMAAGSSHTCAISSNQTVKCWGYDGYGETRAPSDLGIIKGISAGKYFNCVISLDDTVRCWGRSEYGITAVPHDLGPVSSIDSGAVHTCAVKTDGKIECWGLYPSVPSDLGSFTSVTAGDYHTCAIQDNGTVQCWGQNSYGQIAVPTNLGAARMISAGGNTTCAVKDNGTVSCWGHNAYGMSTVPSDLGTVSSISLGDRHSCAVKSDGQVRCWGNDEFGQSTVPSDLGAVRSVSLGDIHTCAVRSDDTIQCWGTSMNSRLAVPAEFQ